MIEYVKITHLQKNIYQMYDLYDVPIFRDYGRNRMKSVHLFIIFCKYSYITNWIEISSYFLRI